MSINLVIARATKKVSDAVIGLEALTDKFQKKFAELNFDQQITAVRYAVEFNEAVGFLVESGNVEIYAQVLKISPDILSAGEFANEVLDKTRICRAASNIESFIDKKNEEIVARAIAALKRSKQ